MAIPGAKKVTFILLNLILPSICRRGNQGPYSHILAVREAMLGACNP